MPLPDAFWFAMGPFRLGAVQFGTASHAAEIVLVQRIVRRGRFFTAIKFEITDPGEFRRAGATFNFEPVPTDVEYDGRGALVASLLPGGPEDASLGARGSVVRITLHGHHDRRASKHAMGWGRGHCGVVASGFLGATNVAVDPRGRIYVSELFGNQISVIGRGGARPLLSVPSPAGLEYSRGSLVASTDVFAAGNLVRIRL